MNLNMEKFRENFGARLHTLRCKKKLSQKELADKLGVSRGSISFYELGERTPDIEFLTSVASFFNVSADSLLGSSDIETIRKELPYLGEAACKQLTENDDPCIFIFLDDLLSMPVEMLADISRKYISHVHAVNVIDPVYQKNKDRIADKKIATGIVINGEELPPVSIGEVCDYTRFNLARAFLKFADREETSDNG